MNAIIWLKRSAGLYRLPIALFTAYSALTGYFLGSGKSVATGFITFFGVFILASAASALNQYQEHRIDASMERTKHRPLPSGRMSPADVLFLVLLLVLAGLALLFFGSGPLPALLGAGTLAWYNGVYTRLKRRTAFAAVPGALVGMMPPAIGWSSTGASLSDPRLLALCFLFFLWQVPHFWVHIMEHGKEYEHAGLPSLTSVLTRPAIARVTFTWVFATAVSGLLLPLYGSVHTGFLYFLLVPGAACMLAAAFRLLNTKPARPAPGMLRVMNAYILFVLTILSVDALV